MDTWDITRTQYKVSDFLSWQRAKSLVLSPSFQRRPVWKPGAKSFLVDTVIRGLPMPIIFLREQKTSLETLEPKREVVDGQQRLRTLLIYIDSTCLPDFNKERDEFEIRKTHNTILHGKKFSELDTKFKQCILDYQFSVHVLPAQVDDREVVQLFARMNATGVQLNSQELRNAGFYGELKTCIYELAAEQLQRWRSWHLFSEFDIARMQEVEMVSEFALLDAKGVSHKSQKTLNKLYEEKDRTYSERKSFERKFRTTMDAIDHHLGKELNSSAFRKKPIFYSLFATVFALHFGLRDAGVEKKSKPMDTGFVDWLREASASIENKTAPQKVLEAVARRTTNPGSRLRVIKYLAKRA